MGNLMRIAMRHHWSAGCTYDGWPLRRIHDLETFQEAITWDADLARFLAACQRITEYYIETRYPIGVTTPLQRATLEADLKELLGRIFGPEGCHLCTQVRARNANMCC